MQNLITIVALSVDSRHAVLYRPDGSTVVIPQGDARLPRIVAASKESLGRKMPALVDITVILPERTEFAAAEKGTKGMVKFFKVAKSFLKGLVTPEVTPVVAVEIISPLELGVFPNAGTKEESEAPQEVVPDPVKAPSEMTTNELAAELVEFTPEQEAIAKEVVDEVLAARPKTNDQKLDEAQVRMHALIGNKASRSTSHPEFHAPLKDDETIVAVHATTGAIIPDAQSLARQLRSSQKLENYVGFQKFIERLASIIDDRGHSVEDLMKFIEKGDLPIAEDGSIIIYKRLNQLSGEIFVDVHSSNIKQKVGSYVFMAPELVDPDRRQDCSNGLHVAALGYLRSFSGNVTIMAKVRPEDVFAVPQYDHNKMRVCGYHILAKLPPNLATLVNNGGSISSDPAGAQLLSNVLMGHHVSITQHVQVGGHKGTNVTYTDVKVNSADQLPVTVVHALTKAETLDMQEALEAKAPVVADVLASDLVKPADKTLLNNVMSNRVKKAPSKAKKSAKKKAKPAAKKTVKAPVKVATTKKPSQAEQAAELYNNMRDAMRFPEEVKAAQALLELKKKARKSWSALGLSDELGAKVLEACSLADTTPVVQKVDTPKKESSKVNSGDKEEALKLLKDERNFTQSEIAERTGLSKDQVYRLKKKLST